MPRKWTEEEIINIAIGYQKASLLFAAADLDLFTTLIKKPMTAEALCAELDTDYRATSVLLNALVAMALLTKQNAKYTVTPTVADLLCQTKPQSILPMVRHHANCHRRWVQLPQITKSGKPAELSPSIRGEAADNTAFIGARKAFLAGKDALLNWEYGLEITKLVQATYLSAERRQTIDLTDPAVQKQLDSYTSLIAQGKGAEVLCQ